MSHNNKNARQHAAARQISATHKSGGKGPARTEPKHGKKNAWWQKFPSYRAYLSGGKPRGAQDAA